MSVDNRGTHNASCENRTPCVFPSGWGIFFTDVKACERGRVKDFEQRSRVYNGVRYNAVYIC